MSKTSAGLLLFRRRGSEIEVFLVHPGGPFWAKKDAGAWSIPKGETDLGEDALAAAVRETREETGFSATGPFINLGSIRQPGGKTVHAFGAEADLNADAIVSNTFTLEWPPRSGVQKQFPEIDRAAWYPLSAAREKIHPAQAELLDRLLPAIEPS